MRPKVAIDVTPLLYTANGIGRCTRSLVQAMLHRAPEMDFTLFGRRLGGASLNAAGFPARTVHLRLPRKAEGFIQALGLVELACRADLYHATDFYTPLKHPEHAVATIHDVIFLTDPEPGVDHVRLARWVGAFARECRAILTCSHFCKREIVRTLGVDASRVHVVYWGVDREVFHAQTDTDALRHRLRTELKIARPYFLAVSCSTGRKNTPRLLRAYQRLLEQGSSADLVLVWTPPREILSTCQAQVESGRIRFIGRVSDALLRDLYAGAMATVYPSLHEGFGLPVLEAMSCGSPVVTSRASCLPEIAGAAAILVDPEDQDDILAAMAGFETQSLDVGELRRRGLLHVNSFTWDRCAQQTVEVYRAALQA